uniref:Fe2OG dioxygenase domain-containing protein n=1 Tax=Grammatophora oceanica TaxID=210454 RepID=A0A7S1YKR8_9STRA
MEIASREGLERSTVGLDDFIEEIDDDGVSETRTSSNTWVDREYSPIIDSIYRRAADLMRIDEALFRKRNEYDEHIDGVDDRRECAESLQLVHYNVSQEYLPHHDFGYPSHWDELKHQEQRFATLLLYLSEDMIGGQTSFPRWHNAETFEALRCEPELGKAVLFYSQLPDGNMDEYSQHAARPVFDGEKYLINLWVKDPIIPEDDADDEEEDDDDDDDEDEDDVE